MGRPIRRITLTHAHVDHAGSLDALRQALPDAELVLPERTAAFLWRRYQPAARRTPGPAAAAASSRPKRQAGSHDPARRPLWDRCAWSPRPATRPDQVAFFDERDGTLIAGDAFQTLGGFAVSGVMRWRFPLPAQATWHLPTAVHERARLAALQPARLAVGHGSGAGQSRPGHRRRHR